MIRPSYRVWADSDLAQVTDPDLDVAHPGGEGGNSKYERGWVVEKEPHQWINYILQTTDVAFSQLLSQGALSWDATVSYVKGSTAYYNGEHWTCLQSNLGQEPVEGSLYWEVSFANMLKSEWDVIVSNFMGQLNAHKALIGPDSNAHNDNITQIGGYTSQEIDDLLTTAGDAASTHIGRTDNPHNLTLEQVNCLSALLGGEFTGTVTYNSVNLASDTYKVEGKATAGEIVLFSNGNTIGLKNGLPMYVSKDQEIVSQKSYARIRAEHELKFSSREPEFEIPLQGSLHSVTQGNFTLEYSRPSVLSYTDRAGNSVTVQPDIPAFGQFGLVLTVDTVLNIECKWSGPATVQFYRDGMPNLFDDVLDTHDLVSIIGGTGSISNLRIWQVPLTNYEKSTKGG